MRLNSLTVLFTDLDVDPYYPAPSHSFAQAGVVNQRPTMRHVGFHDHVWLHLVNHLLYPDHIFRELDNGSTHPAESVGVLQVSADFDPLVREQREGLPTVKVEEA